MKKENAALSYRSLLSGLLYTLLIGIAASLAMLYPWMFTQWGALDLKKLIVPLLMIIMFGMGTSMSLRDFEGVIKMPKGVLIGLICQFSIMPLVGAGLAYISQLPPEIAAGVILVGSSPSGLASNVMSFIARANLALSITLTAVATLLAPLITPFLMKALAGQFIEVDFLAMMWSIAKIVIIPIFSGIIVNRLLRGSMKKVQKIFPYISMGGIVFIIAIITAAGRDALLDIGFVLILVVILHNTAGYFLGYSFSRLAGMDKKSARTIALEVGMQNSGLASGIALEMGKVATMGLASVVFGPWMNISGSAMASWWRESP